MHRTTSVIAGAASLAVLLLASSTHAQTRWKRFAASDDSPVVGCVDVDALRPGAGDTVRFQYTVQPSRDRCGTGAPLRSATAECKRLGMYRFLKAAGDPVGAFIADASEYVCAHVHKANSRSAPASNDPNSSCDRYIAALDRCIQVAPDGDKRSLFRKLRAVAASMVASDPALAGVTCKTDLPQMEICLGLVRPGAAAAPAPQPSQERLSHEPPTHSPSQEASLPPSRNTADRPSPRETVEAHPAVDDRANALSASPRVPVENRHIIGSISRLGARFDDLTLWQGPGRSAPLALLSPASMSAAFFADFGWLSASGETVKLPDSGTLWQTASTRLQATTPVVLTFDNGTGLRFRRTIALDDGYMFSIKDEVANHGAEPVTLFPYARLGRREAAAVPGQDGVRMVADSGGGAHDYSEQTIAEKRTVSFDATGAWLGMTAHRWMVQLWPGATVHLKGRFSAAGTDMAPFDQADYVLDARTVAPGETIAVTSRLFVSPPDAAVAYHQTLK
jgi:YidC/Oxa1 family membrane protein insertase